MSNFIVMPSFISILFIVTAGLIHLDSKRTIEEANGIIMKDLGYTKGDLVKHVLSDDCALIVRMDTYNLTYYLRVSQTLQVVGVDAEEIEPCPH